MRFDIITLFPELFTSFLEVGVTRRAYASGQVAVHCWNPRDYAPGNYRRVDDRPFGGGPGMVMMAQPLADCLAAIRAARAEAGADSGADGGVGIAAPLVLCGLAPAWLLRWRVNLLTLADDEAQAMGINVARLRLVRVTRGERVACDGRGDDAGLIVARPGVDVRHRRRR